MKLFLCFLPIIIIYIIMKLVLLLEETHKEYDYVKREPERERGPYVDEPYGELEEEDEWV